MSTRVRTMTRADVPAAAALFQRRARSQAVPAPRALTDYFERLLFDSPWVDEDLPSLVAEADDGGLVGMVGNHPRRFRLDSRPVRVSCSGPLVTDPEHPGVGTALMRTYLRGPQDVSLTDGASADMHRMWSALRGRVNTPASFGWERVLRPAATAADLMRRRGQALPAPLRRALGAGDVPLRRLPKVGPKLAPVPVDDLDSEPLTVELLLEQTAAASRHWRLHPDYDEKFLVWLFDELDAVAPVRGEVVRRLVRGPRGRVLGWYVYFAPPAGVAQVQQVAAPGGDATAVLDHLIADADARGAVSVAGRIEPALSAAVRRRRFWIGPTTWSLITGGDLPFMGLLDSTQALMTRLDGEWWMAPHLLWRDGPGA